jgi:Ca2+/H+ antiporter
MGNNLHQHPVYLQRTRDEHNLLLDKDDEDGEAIENPTRTCFKAISLLLLGTAMAAAFADPLVDAVHNFSNATSIPSFFISFIAMPLATNSSEAVSAIIFASRKKQRTLSLTFSEVLCLLNASSPIEYLANTVDAIRSNNCTLY